MATKEKYFFYFQTERRRLKRFDNVVGNDEYVKTPSNNKKLRPNQQTIYFFYYFISNTFAPQFVRTKTLNNFLLPFFELGKLQIITKISFINYLINKNKKNPFSRLTFSWLLFYFNTLTQNKMSKLHR